MFVAPSCKRYGVVSCKYEALYFPAGDVVCYPAGTKFYVRIVVFLHAGAQGRVPPKPARELVCFPARKALYSPASRAVTLLQERQCSAGKCCCVMKPLFAVLLHAH
jgi:hypothetical protein